MRSRNGGCGIKICVVSDEKYMQGAVRTAHAPFKLDQEPMVGFPPFAWCFQLALDHPLRREVSY